MLHLHSNATIERILMHRLPVTIFSLTAPTLAGVGVVVALVSGVSSGAGLGLAAGLGALIAVPFSWFVARKLGGSDQTED